MTLICPLCKNILQESATSYSCANRHNFDKSKEGYTNLLLSNRKDQGDDTMMLQARRRFLESGYYETLIENIVKDIEQYYGKKSLTILDLGCGEGRYLRTLQEKRADRDDSFFALDISKQAVKMAAKKSAWCFIVANANNIPLSDGSCDVIISIFSPIFEQEVHRCLKPWWKAIIVWPWPQHLYRFIEMIWDSPHGHQSKTTEEKHSMLQTLDTQICTIPLSLQAPYIQDLFMMTPYYWKAPKTKQEAIMDLQALDIEAQFIIETLQKK